MKKSLYEILGVAPGATADDIAAAHAAAMHAFEAGNHDRNEWIMVREAFGVLSNPAKRAQYDRAQAAPAAVIPVAMEEVPAGLPWMKLGIGLFVLIVGIGWWRSKAPQVPKADAPGALVVAGVSNAPTEKPSAAQQQSDFGVAMPAAVLNAEQLFALRGPSTARVTILDGDGHKLGHGSGVVIGAETLITNCHVAKEGASLSVRLGSHNYNATVDIADEEHDLCQLHVPGMTGQAVDLGSVSALHVGQKVYAIGAPMGLDLTISDGIVSQLRNVSGGTLIQTTAPVSPGSSGGGLFDANGRLVGIITFQASQGQNLNFAAPADWLSTMRSRPQGNAFAKRIGSISGNDEEGSTASVQSPAERIIGEWNCHDVIGGRSLTLDFRSGGRLIARNGNKGASGSWNFDGKRMYIQLSDWFTNVAVEDWNDSKIILNFGDGYRSVCQR